MRTRIYEMNWQQRASNYRFWQVDFWSLGVLMRDERYGTREATNLRPNIRIFHHAPGGLLEPGCAHLRDADGPAAPLLG